jgi:hypothetical protein
MPTLPYIKRCLQCDGMDVLAVRQAFSFAKEHVLEKGGSVNSLPACCAPLPCCSMPAPQLAALQTLPPALDRTCTSLPCCTALQAP